jgi:hypothetical protein
MPKLRDREDNVDFMRTDGVEAKSWARAMFRLGEKKDPECFARLVFSNVMDVILADSSPEEASMWNGLLANALYKIAENDYHLLSRSDYLFSREKNDGKRLLLRDSAELGNVDAAVESARVAFDDFTFVDGSGFLRPHGVAPKSDEENIADIKLWGRRVVESGEREKISGLVSEIQEYLRRLKDRRKEVSETGMYAMRCPRSGLLPGEKLDGHIMHCLDILCELGFAGEQEKINEQYYVFSKKIEAKFDRGLYKEAAEVVLQNPNEVKWFNEYKAKHKTYLEGRIAKLVRKIAKPGMFVATQEGTVFMVESAGNLTHLDDILKKINKTKQRLDIFCNQLNIDR